MQKVQKIQYFHNEFRSLICNIAHSGLAKLEILLLLLLLRESYVSINGIAKSVTNVTK